MNAALAVEGIIEDLSDRRGLRHEWDAIDEDVQQEIRDAWTTIVEARISAAVAEEREVILKLLTESAFDLIQCPTGERCDHASALDCAADAIRSRGSQKGEPS